MTAPRPPRGASPPPPLVFRAIEIAPDDCQVFVKVQTCAGAPGGTFDLFGLGLRFTGEMVAPRGGSFDFDDPAVLVQLRDALDQLITEAHADGLFDTPEPEPDCGPPAPTLARAGKLRPRRLRYRPDGGAA